METGGGPAVQRFSWLRPKLEIGKRTPSTANLHQNVAGSFLGGSSVVRKEKWSREIKRSTVRLPHQLMAEWILTSLEPNSHFLLCNVGSSLIAAILVLSAIAVLASDVSRSAEKQ